MNRPPGADGAAHPVGLAGQAVAGPLVRRQLLPTTTVYGRADRGAFAVLGLRAEIDAAAREFSVPPELIGAIVLHESQAGERSFFGGGGLADLAERAEAAVSSDPSIGIGQMKVSLASGLRTRHPTLAGSGSVVGDLLDRTRAVRYVAAHLGEIGGQIDAWLASQGVTPTADERRDLIAIAYNMGWVSLRDRNLLDPGLGPDVPSRITALRSRNVYLNRTIGNLRLVTDALAGRPPSGTTIRTLGLPPWIPRYRR